MKIKVIGFFAALSLVLMGCQQGSMPSKQTSGAVLGGVTGGIVGSQLGKGKGNQIAIVAGTLLGAALGGMVGNSMDQTDALSMQRALNTNNPTGQPVSWNNPNTNAQYQVTPTSTFQNTQNQTCREYTTVGVIDGKREEIHGTACQQADGTWSIVQQ
ncbi:17 kDa surface antigen precursor [Beggiatoa sp. PS]|nr:17 kDa surface antigen precursor [Beggiatoa sp. PS]